MSLNLEMLQVARLSSKLLGDSAGLVADFLRGLQNEDGGFADRAGKSDLYYTAFGIGGLLGLQLPLPVARLRSYLMSFGDGAGLDLVYLGCLGRCWSALPSAERVACPAQKILERIEKYRTPDGGYSVEAGAKFGTVYGCFLAMGAYQDFGAKLPNPDKLLDCVQGLRCPDGGYANGAEMPLGLTPPTAAAAAILRQLGVPAESSLSDWLLMRFHPQGGFCVSPDIAMPDLLSTATALHALAGMQTDFSRLKELCLDYVDTLWNARGGFHGNWEDDELDCEYTYYGLLALGHLSL